MRTKKEKFVTIKITLPLYIIREIDRMSIGNKRECVRRYSKIRGMARDLRHTGSVSGEIEVLLGLIDKVALLAEIPESFVLFLCRFRNGKHVDAVGLLRREVRPVD